MRQELSGEGTFQAEGSKLKIQLALGWREQARRRVVETEQQSRAEKAMWVIIKAFTQ